MKKKTWPFHWMLLPINEFYWLYFGIDVNIKLVLKHATQPSNSVKWNRSLMFITTFKLCHSTETVNFVVAFKLYVSIFEKHLHCKCAFFFHLTTLSIYSKSQFSFSRVATTCVNFVGVLKPKFKFNRIEFEGDCKRTQQLPTSNV